MLKKRLEDLALAAEQYRVTLAKLSSWSIVNDEYSPRNRVEAAALNRLYEKKTKEAEEYKAAERYLIACALAIVADMNTYPELQAGGGENEAG